MVRDHHPTVELGIIHHHLPGGQLIHLCRHYRLEELEALLDPCTNIMQVSILVNQLSAINKISPTQICNVTARPLSPLVRHAMALTRLLSRTLAPLVWV